MGWIKRRRRPLLLVVSSWGPLFIARASDADGTLTERRPDVSLLIQLNHVDEAVAELCAELSGRV